MFRAWSRAYFFYYAHIKWLALSEVGQICGSIIAVFDLILLHSVLGAITY
jgi:hypothetical protein